MYMLYAYFHVAYDKIFLFIICVVIFSVIIGAKPFPMYTVV
jgi:hypothetical protein